MFGDGDYKIIKEVIRMSKTPEWQFKNRMLGNYLEDHSRSKEQKHFDIFMVAFLCVPLILICFSPFVFVFWSVKAGIVIVSLMGISQLISILYVLKRKKHRFDELLSIKQGDERIEKIELTEIENYDEFYQGLALMLCMKAEISDEFIHLVYNWLNNMQLLKDEPLKIYFFDGYFVNANGDNEMENDTNIMSVLAKDLNLNEETLTEYCKQHYKMFGHYPETLM